MGEAPFGYSVGLTSFTGTFLGLRSPSLRFYKHRDLVAKDRDGILIGKRTESDYITAELDPEVSKHGGYFVCATAPPHTDMDLAVQGYEERMS